MLGRAGFLPSTIGCLNFQVFLIFFAAGLNMFSSKQCIYHESFPQNSSDATPKGWFDTLANRADVTGEPSIFFRWFRSSPMLEGYQMVSLVGHPWVDITNMCFVWNCKCIYIYLYIETIFPFIRKDLMRFIPVVYAAVYLLVKSTKIVLMIFVQRPFLGGICPVVCSARFCFWSWGCFWSMNPENRPLLTRSGFPNPLMPPDAPVWGA